eukprot:PITA_28731
MITDGFDKTKSEQAEKHNLDWENLCKQEEIFWRQKSRVQWLKEGKLNTRFFHRSTIANRKHNRISSILNEYGEIQTSHKDIEAVMVQHFRGITNENNLDRDQHIKEIIKNIPRMVSREDNFKLNKPVIEAEVSTVIKDVQNGKATGPNGFNVDFFKACWNVVKHDILDVVEDSKRSRSILKALNISFISLIPKQDSALTPDKFRPIALCNVVYKIISKILANKLKPLLPSLIFGEQSGYVEGRKILDNIIQAREVVHSLTSKRQASMIMQLDIAKAYDKVNWIYIKNFFSTFGFDHDWIRWVMAFVTSPNFSILVNGLPSEIFTPSRGLRYGSQSLQIKFVFLNTNISIQRNISRILGFQREVLPSKYLGIPLTDKPMHKSIWESVLNKMLKALNLAGRLILTKAVLQSIPIFFLSALSAPKGVL